MWRAAIPGRGDQDRRGREMLQRYFELAYQLVPTQTQAAAPRPAETWQAGEKKRKGEGPAAEGPERG